MRATRAFREDLKAVLAKHGFDLLVDDGMWLWRDDYTDSCLVYLRPTGWLERWRARYDFERWKPMVEAKEKADPVSEIGPNSGFCDMCHRPSYLGHGVMCPDAT